MKILKISLTFCSLLFTIIASFGQAKKPTLMVIPSDNWCINNNFYTTVTNQGVTEKIPDYSKAVQEDFDLLNVTTKIGELMSERGFPLKDLSAVMRDIKRSNVEHEMTTSRRGGASLDETPLEIITNRAKADIIIDLNWKINQVGPKRSVTYNMRGLDSYTNKQIASASGTGQPSFSAEDAVLLEEAVIANMDNFLGQLQDYFDDLLENGREISLNVLLFDNGSISSFSDEFDGMELTEIIDNWVSDNTVEHRYNLSDDGDTHLTFEQVRIPIYRANGRPMDTREFANMLRKYLSGPPFNLVSKVYNKGLGRAELVIGDK